MPRKKQAEKQEEDVLGGILGKGKAEPALVLAPPAPIIPKRATTARCYCEALVIADGYDDIDELLVAMAQGKAPDAEMSNDRSGKLVVYLKKVV